MTLDSQPSPSSAPPESPSSPTAASASLTSLSLAPEHDDGDHTKAIAIALAPVMPPPKPTPRARVPLEKGYSQMVWLRLLQTEPDLAGLKGKSPKRLITIEEVKQHKTEEDAWTVLRGRVYNISPYIRFHPGGKDMLMKGAGRDCTALFSIFILAFANWCYRRRLNGLFLCSLFGFVNSKDSYPFSVQVLCVFKLYCFCVWNARLDLTVASLRQVSYMGERRVSDGEVLVGHFGRSPDVAFVFSVL